MQSTREAKALKIGFVVAVIGVIISGGITILRGSEIATLQNPCIDTLGTAKIIAVTAKPDQTVLVDLLGQGMDKVQQMQLASTTPHKDDFKAGKLLKVCYVLE